MRSSASPEAVVTYGAPPLTFGPGALLRQRLLAASPCPVTADDLAGIFARSMELW